MQLALHVCLTLRAELGISLSLLTHTHTNTHVRDDGHGGVPGACEWKALEDLIEPGQGEMEEGLAKAGCMRAAI